MMSNSGAKISPLPTPAEQRSVRPGRAPWSRSRLVDRPPEPDHADDDRRDADVQDVPAVLLAKCRPEPSAPTAMPNDHGTNARPVCRAL